MIEVILFTLVGYPIFGIVAYNLLGIRFTKKIYPYVIAIGVTCALQILFQSKWGDPQVDLIIFGCDMVAMLLLAEKDKWKAFGLFPIVYFLTAIVNLLMSYLEAAILGITQNEIRLSFALTMIIEPSAVIVFSIIGFIIRKMKIKEVKINWGQYFVQIVGVIAFFIQVGIIQGFVEGDPLVWQYKKWIIVATIVSSFLFFGLTILQQIICTKNFVLQKDNENYRKFLENQEQYVNLVIRADEKKRKMHHDMRAHITALLYLSEKEDMEAIKTYVKEMENDITKVEVEKFTSIYVVDAIISEWYQRIEKNGIEWQWSGTLADSEKYSSYDLCVIFSNLLSNACEAVDKCDESKYIHLKCAVIEGRYVIDIMNSCVDQIISNEKPSTSKADKTSHGYGLQNIEDVVNKYNGTIEYDRQINIFHISIVI